MTGIVTASTMPSTMVGSDMRETPPCGADVGGHALERHDGDRAGVLGDLGLLGVDDVHDDAALEHLGEARLDPERAGLLAACQPRATTPSGARSRTSAACTASVGCE